MPTPRGSELMTLKQFVNPKPNYCTWRLSKRRLQDSEGNWSRAWLGRCIECNARHIDHYKKTNNKAKEKRHRIKQDEHEFLCGIHCVQVNSLDIIAWPLFARLNQNLLACHDTETKVDVVEALRKIAAKVLLFLCVYS